jgi:hypothetical protein
MRSIGSHRTNVPEYGAASGIPIDTSSKLPLGQEPRGNKLSGKQGLNNSVTGLISPLGTLLLDTALQSFLSKLLIRQEGLFGGGAGDAVQKHAFSIIIDYINKQTVASFNGFGKEFKLFLFIA